VITRDTITLRQAYDKGFASQRTSSDWDEALMRFSRRYCQPHNPREMCDLEQCWSDGFDDANEYGNDGKKRRPAADATERVNTDLPFTR
jgi:hypothetical protein